MTTYPPHHPIVQHWLRQEARRDARRREYLLRERPALFIDLDLVEVVTEAVSPQARALSERVLPGSVLVAHGDARGCCIVDYEGGLLTRGANRQPTDKERRDYVLIAAGRAAEHAPTVARAFGIPRSDLRVIGRCNVGEGRIDWF